MAIDPLDRLLSGPDETVTPRPEFADALLRQLLTALTDGPDDPSHSAERVVAALPIAATMVRPRVYRGRAPHHWSTMPAVAVSLLALALMYAAIVVWPSHHTNPMTIPAASIPTPTPQPDQTNHITLITLALAAGELPTLNGGGSSLFLDSIPAGASWSWSVDSDRCCHGLVIDYVLSGSYSIRFANDPVRVVRASGVTQTIAAGTDVTLGSSDALISRSEYDHEGVNAGAAPVQLLRWDFSGEPSDLVIPTHWVINADDPHFFLADVAPGRATVTLRKVALLPKQSYQAPGAVRSDLVFAVSVTSNAAGETVEAKIANLDDGRILNYGADPIDIYVLTLEPFAGSSSTPAATATSPG